MYWLNYAGKDSRFSATLYWINCSDGQMDKIQSRIESSIVAYYAR